MNPERADIKLALIAPRLPDVTVAMGGPLAQVAAMLSLGPFSFGDPVKLVAQLQVMANSLNSYVAPNLSASLKMDVAAVMKLALVAKLMAQLKLAGLDPLSATFAESVGAMARTPMPSAKFALTPPQLGNIKLMAGLPALVKACAVLNVPLGDPAARAMLMAKLGAMASIKPPTLSVKMSAMLKMAAVVSAVASITETFGPEAFTLAGQSKIAFMLKAVASLAIPIPPLKLDAVATLPPMEDVLLGEK